MEPTVSLSPEQCEVCNAVLSHRDGQAADLEACKDCDLDMSVLEEQHKRNMTLAAKLLGHFGPTGAPLIGSDNAP